MSYYFRLYERDSAWRRYATLLARSARSRSPQMRCLAGAMHAEETYRQPAAERCRFFVRDFHCYATLLMSPHADAIFIFICSTAPALSLSAAIDTVDAHRCC